MNLSAESTRLLNRDVLSKFWHFGIAATQNQKKELNTRNFVKYESDSSVTITLRQRSVDNSILMHFSSPSALGRENRMFI